ncbi:MAG: helix-hairpin-helix domain-containing protein [Cellulosilyticaceae bacterium]
MLKLLNKYKIILIVIVLTGTLGCYRYYKTQQVQQAFQLIEDEKQSVKEEETVAVIEERNDAIPMQVPVYVCGQVKKPDVYQLASDALVKEAISIAGGFLEEADKEVVNLARVIVPNEKIYIPKIGEKIDKTAHSYDNSKEGTSLGQHININEADLTALKDLPGIGDVKAQQIIDYRTTNGPFKNKEAIKEVTGIGEKTYSQIEAMITTE